MAKWVTGACAIGWIVVVGLGCVADLALCDYHAPQTDLLDANLSFSYRYFDDPETDGVDVDSGWLKLSYRRVADAPDVGYSLSGTAKANLSGFVPSGGVGSAAATMRYYLGDAHPLFAFGGLEGGMATGQAAPGLQVQAGIGYGRFSDVTPLAKTLRIQSELQRLGSLRAPLGDDTLLAVAEEVGRVKEFSEIDDLVAVVEALIETDAGVILGARALLRVEEIILEQGDERNCGWVVQAGLGYEVVDAFGEPRNVLLTASADAALASGPSSQWLVRCSLSGPFDILRRHTFTATVSSESMVLGEALVQSDLSLQRVKSIESAATTTVSAAISVAFDVGGADVGLSFSLSKAAGSSAWARDVTLAASMDLLQEKRPHRAWDSGTFELDEQ